MLCVIYPRILRLKSGDMIIKVLKCLAQDLRLYMQKI